MSLLMSLYYLSGFYGKIASQTINYVAKTFAAKMLVTKIPPAKMLLATVPGTTPTQVGLLFPRGGGGSACRSWGIGHPGPWACPKAEVGPLLIEVPKRRFWQSCEALIKGLGSSVSLGCNPMSGGGAVLDPPQPRKLLFPEPRTGLRGA